MARLLVSIARASLTLVAIGLILWLAASSGSPWVFGPAFVAAILFTWSLLRMARRADRPAEHRDG